MTKKVKLPKEVCDALDEFDFLFRRGIYHTSRIHGIHYDWLRESE
jgi:hypothetical protein